MKSLIIGRESKQISIALDNESVQKLIETLQDFQKNKLDNSFPVETTGSDIDLVFIPFDLLDKRIRGFE